MNNIDEVLATIGQYGAELRSGEGERDGTVYYMLSDATDYMEGCTSSQVATLVERTLAELRLCGTAVTPVERAKVMSDNFRSMTNGNDLASFVQLYSSLGCNSEDWALARANLMHDFESNPDLFEISTEFLDLLFDFERLIELELKGGNDVPVVRAIIARQRWEDDEGRCRGEQIELLANTLAKLDWSIRRLAKAMASAEVKYTVDEDSRKYWGIPDGITSLWLSELMQRFYRRLQEVAFRSVDSFILDLEHCFARNELEDELRSHGVVDDSLIGQEAIDQAINFELSTVGRDSEGVVLSTMYCAMLGTSRVEKDEEILQEAINAYLVNHKAPRFTY